MGATLTAESPQLSVVVVTYNMRREALRTLYTLTPGYQGIDPGVIEVVVVDNGSSAPLGQQAVVAVDPSFRYVELPPGNPSPAAALNHGVALSRAPAVALMIDGARMFTPGFVRYALQALQLHARPVISTPGLHLGAQPQQQSVAEGYNAAAEEALLQTIPWRRMVIGCLKSAAWLVRRNMVCLLPLPRAMPW